MTIEELRGLAQAGVKIEISAAELLQAFTQMIERQQPKEWKLLTLQEAAVEYGCSVRTVQRHIKDGVIRGEQIGGVWRVESPRTRYERVFGN